ncbi:hypothetical protein D3C75_1040700 [compost metagenome]
MELDVVPAISIRLPDLYICVGDRVTVGIDDPSVVGHGDATIAGLGNRLTMVERWRVLTKEGAKHTAFCSLGNSVLVMQQIYKA